MRAWVETRATLHGEFFGLTESHLLIQREMQPQIFRLRPPRRIALKMTIGGLTFAVSRRSRARTGTRYPAFASFCGPGKLVPLLQSHFNSC